MCIMLQEGKEPIDPGTCEDSLQIIDKTYSDEETETLLSVEGIQTFISHSYTLSIALTTCFRYKPDIDTGQDLLVRYDKTGK